MKQGTTEVNDAGMKRFKKNLDTLITESGRHVLANNQYMKKLYLKKKIQRHLNP